MKQNNLVGILLCVLLSSLPLLSGFAGGGEGYFEITWDDLKQVKGGASECVITVQGEDELFPETKAAFDTKGRLVELDMGYSIQKFTYNNNGIAEIEFGGKDENGEYTIYAKTLYVYNPKGNLIKISYQDAEKNEYMSEEGITYDKNGNVKIERLTPEGSVYKIDTYNKNFYLTESLVYTTESVAMGYEKKEIDSKTSVKYDKDNNILEKTIEYVNPPFEGIPKKIVQSFTYEFDKKGNKTLQKTTLAPKDVSDIFPDLAHPPVLFRYNYGEAKTQDASVIKVNQEVMVDWEGTWYPAVVLKQNGDKYLIHYADYDSSWDEWVTKERIQIKK